MRFRAFSFPVDGSRGCVFKLRIGPTIFGGSSAGKLRGVKFPSLPFGKERATSLRAHVGISERFAWTRNRTIKAAHEADLCPVIHPGPIVVVDEYAEPLLLGKVLEDAASEGERHCHTVLVVLGGSAIAGLGSRGASRWLRLMFEGRPRIDAKRAKQEPEKDSSEVAGLLALCILERPRSERQCGQSTAAMRTGSAQNGQSLMPLAGITIPTVCLGRNISKPATEAKGQTVQPSSRALATAAFSGLESLVHTRSLADFITTTSEVFGTPPANPARHHQRRCHDEGLQVIPSAKGLPYQHRLVQ